MRALCILIFLLPAIAHANRYPVSPTEPTVKGAGAKTTRDTAKKETVSTFVRIKLGSGDEISGDIDAPPRITFKHYKNGLLFQMTVQPGDIKAIRVKAYKYRRLRKKKGSSVYEFKPNDVEVSLRTGKTYHLTYLFKFLHKIPISTDDGTTTLYAFFADEFRSKKGWVEVESTDFGYHKSRPHPQSAVEFTFQSPRAGAE